MVFFTNRAFREPVPFAANAALKLNLTRLTPLGIVMPLLVAASAVSLTAAGQDTAVSTLFGIDCAELRHNSVLRSVGGFICTHFDTPSDIRLCE